MSSRFIDRFFSKKVLPYWGVLQRDGTPEVTQFVTTRFGNVLGSNGSVIPIFRDQIRSGGPVTVTHKDIVRYFMLIPEACRLVLAGGSVKIKYVGLRAGEKLFSLSQCGDRDGIISYMHEIVPEYQHSGL